MTIPFSLVSIVTSLRSLSRRAESDREGVYRPLQFHESSQHFIGTHNETLFVIRVYDDAGNVIETHAHKGDFKEF